MRTARDVGQVGVQALERVEDVAARHRDTGSARQHRPHGGDDAALTGQHPVDVPAQRLGQREQAQGLRRGRAVDHDDVPAVRRDLVAQLEQRQHLLCAGQHGELLGGDRVDARRVQNRAQVVLDLRPGALEPALGVDLLHPAARLDLDRLGAHRHRERVGQRVRGIGGQHQGAQPGAPGQHRSAGGRRGLADAPLAGEQQNPHPVTLVACARADRARQPTDSTRFFRPLSAVSMMTFSALRRSMPIIGMETSTASR